jgi:hypothetical protein
MAVLPLPNRVSLFAGVAYFWSLSPPLFPINDISLGLLEEAVTELNNMDTVLPHKEEKNETKGKIPGSDCRDRVYVYVYVCMFVVCCLYACIYVLVM